MAAPEINPNTNPKKDDSASLQNDSSAEQLSASKQPSKESNVIRLHPHHVSNILDEVLEDENAEEASTAVTGQRHKHPMIFDMILTVGLIVAVSGFGLGMFKMYLAHNARLSIDQHNYKTAIAVLKGIPLPGVFEFYTSYENSPSELLNEAYYQDALTKYDAGDISGALSELQYIPPTSNFFTIAQELITANYVPSSTSLQGGTSITEKAAPMRKPLLPELPQDASP